MPFRIVEGDLGSPLPLVRRIRQRLSAPQVNDVPGAIAAEMHKLDARLRPGLRVAVGVGSRGVAQIQQITRSVIEQLKQRGAEPFIVPAMGSHGGATPQGQLALLAGYGVTPASMGVDFDAAMETVPIGQTGDGLPVHFSRAALQADAVLPINRIKVHTEFHGPVESGLTKMLAIGFGKHRGAATLHARGFDTFHATVPAAAAVVFAKVNVLGGVASVENAGEAVAHLEIVPGAAIPAREPELLALSRSLMPRIPFRGLDVLIVDYLGKDISGAGMDPNITGRYAVRHLSDPEVNPQKIVVLRLTAATHGNACGLGMADLTTRAVAENIDYQQYWTNVVTSTELANGRTPIWLPDDRQAIALALRSCNRVDPPRARLVRIHSTLHLTELWVSEALWQAEDAARPDLEALTEPQPLAFNADGHLADLPLPAARHGGAPGAGGR